PRRHDAADGQPRPPRRRLRPRLHPPRRPPEAGGRRPVEQLRVRGTEHLADHSTVRGLNGIFIPIENDQHPRPGHRPAPRAASPPRSLHVSSVLWIALSACGAALAAVVGFLVYVYLRYTPIIGRIFEEKPLFFPLRVPPDGGGEEVRFETADG